MQTRRNFRTSALLAGLGLAATGIIAPGLIPGASTSGLSSAQAQEFEPTAREMFDLAVDLLDRGDTAGARERLRGIDPLQLPEPVRRNYYDLLLQMDNPNAGTPTATPDVVETPDVVVADAPGIVVDSGPAPLTIDDRIEVAASADADEAMRIYTLVLGSDEATDAQKDIAGARLAQLTRAMNPDLTWAREMIDAGGEDITSGNYQAAMIKLESVRDSGVELGFYDQQRIAQRLEVAETRLAELAIANGPVDSVTMSTADEGDVIIIGGGEVGGGMSGEMSGDEAFGLSQAQSVRRSELIAEGDDAYGAGQWDAARAAYAEAVMIESDSDLQDRINEINAKLTSADVAPIDNIESYIAERDLLKQAAMVRYEDRVGSAERFLDANDFSAATEQTQAAIAVVDQQRTLFSQPEYNALRGRADTLLQNIELREARLAQQIADETERLRSDQLRSSRNELAAARRDQVNTLLERSLELRKQGDYEAALSKAEEALFLDPTNPYAELMRDSIQQDMIILQGERYHREGVIQHALQSNDNLEATIPYREIINYPENWPEITKLRLEGLDDSGGESAANRKSQALLDDTIIPTVNFEAMRLRNVIAFLENNTGGNFFPNWTALELAGVDPDTPITLSMRNVTAAQVLDFALKQASNDFEPIGYSIEDGVVVISTEQALSASTDVRIYDIRDLLLPIYDNFNDAPEFDLDSALEDQTEGGGGGGGGLFGDGQDGGNDQEDIRDDLVNDLLALIQDTVGDPLEWVNQGGDVSSVYELRGRLVIRSTGRNHRQIRDLLTDFREFRSIAINVESRILLVDENFLEEVAIDLDVNWTDPGGKFGPIAIAQDSISLAQRGVNTTPATPENFRLSSAVAGPQVVFQPNFGITDGTGISGGGSTSGRGIDFNISYLDDLQVNLLVQATQANQRSVSLTAPRVTFLNGTSAVVIVADQLAFISDLEIVPDAAAFDPEVSVVSSGVILAVEGAVSADRRYVTMNIWPSLSTVDNIRQIPFGGVADVGDGDTTTQIGVNATLEAPELSLTQVRTQVSVPDQGTLLLGGQRLVGEVEVEAGVPVLSKIPFIKRLFTNNSLVKDERTLLILVKPTILLQEEQENQAFPGLNDDPTNYPLD